MRIRAYYLGQNRCEFVVWAPRWSEVKLALLSPKERAIALSKDEQGYWQATTAELVSGALYYYQLGASSGEIFVNPKD